jgi:exopolyphosphatase/guanosine-5'-triphosphate,3'-diphosphate pyrophosphatase
MKYDNRIAVIDCGTNTFHLLIVDLKKDNRFTIIHKEKFPVKIGEGGIEQNIIPEQGIQRALKTLKHFKEKINTFEVKSTTATATSAFRNANNGNTVADLILKETGIKLNIIDGKKEATLIYNGVSRAVNLKADNNLIMDIGGGSVEFILCNKDGIKWLKSYEIGAQRLLEKFHINDPISPINITSLNNYLDKELTELYSICKVHSPTHLLGASGSFDTLSEIYSEEFGDYFNEEETLSFNLPIDKTINIIQDIISKSHEERLAIKGIIALRADMIVVAGILVKRILEKTTFTHITTTSYALKEGLIFSPNFILSKS